MCVMTIIFLSTPNFSYSTRSSFYEVQNILIWFNLQLTVQEMAETYMISRWGSKPRDGGNGPVKLLLSTSLKHYKVWGNILHQKFKIKLLSKKVKRQEGEGKECLHMYNIGITATNFWGNSSRERIVIEMPVVPNIDIQSVCVQQVR